MALGALAENASTIMTSYFVLVVKELDSFSQALRESTGAFYL